MRYEWKVDKAPTGRYRSFQRRSWPSAYYDDGRPAAWVVSPADEEYVPSDVRAGSHLPLHVHVADYSARNGNCEWTRRKLRGEFKTLTEAKAALEALLAKVPGVMPKAGAQ